MLLSLCRDNTPTVVLAEWELKADYFEDDFLSGVSPILFANDPKAAEDAIRANQETAKKDLDRLIINDSMMYMNIKFKRR